MVNKIANNDEVGDRLGYAYPKERKAMKSASDTAGKEKKEELTVVHSLGRNFSKAL